MGDVDSSSGWGTWTLVSAVLWSLFKWSAVSRRRKKIEIEKNVNIIEVYGEHRSDLLCTWSVFFPTLKLLIVLLVAVGFPGASARLPCYAEVFLSAED